MEIFGEFQDLYIRRARDEAQNKAQNASQVPPHSAQAQFPGVNQQQAIAFQAQQFFLMQQLMQQQFVTQQYQMEMYSNQQPVGRNSGEPEDNAANRRNNNNNTSNTNNNNNNRRNGGAGNGRRNNNGGGFNNNNNSSGNSAGGSVQYQKKNEDKREEKQKKNRLRLDSENFPTLDEDPEEIEKKIREIAILKKQDPNRTIFEYTYNRVELMRTFEQIKNTLKCPSNFVELFKNIPVISNEATLQLEQERPTRVTTPEEGETIGARYDLSTPH